MGEKLTNREIGLRLKQCRAAKGYTLQQVAELVGVDRSTIQRYETGGIVVIKRPVVESICTCLGVNPKWVLGESAVKAVQKDAHFADDVLALTRRLSEIPEMRRAKLMENLNGIVDLYVENLEDTQK